MLPLALARVVNQRPLEGLPIRGNFDFGGCWRPEAECQEAQLKLEGRRLESRACQLTLRMKFPLNISSVNPSRVLLLLSNGPIASKFQS